MNAKRSLVTGGAGFLGSYLCETLLKRGHHVLCLDNFVTGQHRNISAHIGNPRFELIEADVRVPYDFQVDEIYNLACPASPERYQADPVSTTMTSVLGAVNALELAARRGIKVLQASTSEVYGDPTVHPQPESYWGNVNPIGLRACYDEGKRCAETLFFDYQRSRNVDIRVARIFNTYGPGMAADDGRVVSNFISQALQNKRITVYGNGSQTRSFCYRDDLVRGLITMMDADGYIDFPINFGNPGEFTVADLAQIILDMTGASSQLVFMPLPSDDPTQRKPDITIAKTYLGWEPRIDLDEGLAKTIKAFVEQLEIRPANLLREASL